MTRMVCPWCATWVCGVCGHAVNGHLRLAPTPPCWDCGGDMGALIPVRHDPATAAVHSTAYEQHQTTVG